MAVLVLPCRRIWLGQKSKGLRNLSKYVLPVRVTEHTRRSNAWEELGGGIVQLTLESRHDTTEVREGAFIAAGKPPLLGAGVIPFDALAEHQYDRIQVTCQEGPDFLAVNRRGDLFLGEVKRGGLGIGAWSQAMRYARRFAKMREKDLDAELGACRSNRFDDTATKNAIAYLAQDQRSRSDQYLSYPPKSTSEHFSDRLLEKGRVKGGTRKATRGFLNSTAFQTLVHRSRRKLQIIFVAEHISDWILRYATRDTLGKALRSRVKDVKCIELRTYRIEGRRTVAVASVVGGRRRRLRG